MENISFMEYLDLKFQEFRDELNVLLREEEIPEIAQMVLISNICKKYTSDTFFESLSDAELRHFARFSLPENQDLIQERFLEFTTEDSSKLVLRSLMLIIRNLHHDVTDLMMYRHTLKKLEEVNKELRALADELGVQLIEA